MSIRTILAAISGGSASAGAMELACRLATRFSAHLEAFHVRSDGSELVVGFAGDFATSIPLEWIEEINAAALEQARKLEQSFSDVAASHGLGRAAGGKSMATAAWRDAVGYPANLVPDRARFFDLVVLGRSERVAARAHTDVVERTLIDSGRPVLLAPATTPATLGDKVAVAWNGSPQAVRALVFAMPFLAEAKSVTLFTVEPERTSDPAAAADYLARHDIRVQHRTIAPVHGAAVGGQLLSAAREEGADLLVMGGYGHGPWREYLFGGATSQVVGESLLPLLLAH